MAISRAREGSGMVFTGTPPSKESRNWVPPRLLCKSLKVSFWRLKLAAGAGKGVWGKEAAEFPPFVMPSH